MIGERILLNMFLYHPPISEAQKVKYEEIRERAHYFAIHINEQVPDSPEKRNAIDALREAVMWANAAIACNEIPGWEYIANRPENAGGNVEIPRKPVDPHDLI